MDEIRKKRKYTKKTPFERAAIKAEKARAAEYEAECSMSVEAWWEAQRAKFPPEVLEAMLQRQEVVRDNLHWMKAHTDGTYNLDPTDENYLSTEEGLPEIVADIKRYGTVFCGTGYADTYRRSEEFQLNAKKFGPSAFGGKTASEIYLLTNILVGLPSKEAYEFTLRYTKGKVEPTRPYAGVIRTVTKKKFKESNNE